MLPPALGERRRESRKLPPVKVSGLTPKIVRRGSRTCLFSNRAGLSEFTMPAEARENLRPPLQELSGGSGAGFSLFPSAGMLDCLVRVSHVSCSCDWAPGSFSVHSGPPPPHVLVLLKRVVAGNLAILRHISSPHRSDKMSVDSTSP